MYSNVTDNRDLLGNWVLTAVGEQAPEAMDIKSWHLEFEALGTWSYAAELAGKYEGLRASGSGKWLVQGDKMEYTGGRTTGETTIRLEGDSLVLSPDPILRVNGTDPVETRYIRRTSK